ncbi:formyltetrahydrofolate deformylase [Porticoccus sp. GXU_MW_L64]
MQERYILTASCASGVGIVAAISGCLASCECDISALEQFDDDSTQRFFTRVVFRCLNDGVSLENIQKAFSQVADRFSMEWAVRPESRPVKVLIMVSQYDHCLNDLLYRCHKGDLNMAVTAIVSNHLDFRNTAEREGIRFVHLPITPENKTQQEARLLEIMAETGSELVVLARYMQILSDDLCQQLSGRCINIHHSFLPGFKGARPYHQAYERGVKVIGATAHYVTSDLDEGPIIEQVLTRVNHNFKPENLVRIGRDNECRALARAVKYHIEGRVFLDGNNKTVVFSGS